MNTRGEHAVVIVAAGKGLRVGADIPKQFLPLAKKPMLMRTIEKFYNFDKAIQIVVVLHQDYFILWSKLCEEFNFDILCELVIGGDTRFDSVKKGLEAVSQSKVVAIHDAARPFVSEKLIAECYSIAQLEQCGVIPVVDEKNSLRHVKGDRHYPLDRDEVKVVQTPQVFPVHLIKKAYDMKFNPQFTDDATVAEKDGVRIRLIQGEDSNIKVTTLTDLNIASFLFELNEKNHFI